MLNLRLIFLSLTFLLSGKVAICQNLVGNPDFETYTDCPPDVGLGWINYIHYATGWMNITPTPDFFHECGSLGGGVPENYFGYQEAHSGSGYAGFVAVNFSVADGIEGITRALEDTLIIDSTYYCSFKLNLAGNLANGCDHIGMRFSTFLESDTIEPGYDPPDRENIAQVYTEVIITDTVNWVHFQGDFVADSAYTYVGVSNFFEQEYISITPGAEDDAAFIYYYVDDICVSLNPEDCGIIPCSEVATLIDTTVCFPFELPSGDTLHSPVDSYTDTIPTIHGCDSLLLINFTSLETYESIEVTSCNTYFSPSGLPYSESGIYLDTIANAMECDSIITIDLTIHLSDTTDLSLVVCDELEWYDEIYIETGLYEHSLTNVHGCDSILRLDLVVNYTSVIESTLIVCDSLNWDDSTYIESGIIENTYSDILGCDSIVQIDLTVNNSVIHETSASACEEYAWFGDTYTSNGTYEHLLLTDAGCDSLIQLDLIINHSSSSDTIADACDAFDWYDDYLTESGEYERLLTTEDGCDSLVTLNLTIHHADSMWHNRYKCAPYLWIDGIEYYEENNEARYVLTDIYGCDSVLKLNLTIKEVDVGVTVSGLSLTADRDFADYQWLDCDSGYAIIDGATEQEYTGVETGNYAVEITWLGCVDTSDCKDLDAVSIENESNFNNFNLYPNPFDDYTNLNFGRELTESHTIIIYDVLGQIVYQNKNVSGSSLKIERKNLVAGSYILSIYNSNLETLFTSILMIE